MTLPAQLEAAYGLRWDEDRARHPPAPGTGVQAALDALLIGETYFCRYPLYLELLRQRLAAAGAGGRFRVLCAACSTGEEAYSVAFALAAAAEAQGTRLEVEAADARHSAIAAAVSATYGAWSLRSVDTATRTRLVEPCADGRFRVREPYRSLPRFTVRNLLEPVLRGGFDAVVLTNATLYMRDDAAAAAYRNMADALKPDGVLLLAPTDPAPGPGWFRSEQPVGWSVFTRQPAIEPVAAAAPPPPTPIPVARTPVVPARNQPPATEQDLWAAWAAGRLADAHERIRELVFYEPGEPLWRFLNGALLWERGWLRRAQKEMETAARQLSALPEGGVIRGLCTAGELARMVAFWSERHG